MLKIFPLNLNSILLLPELPLSCLGGLMPTLMVTAIRFHLTDLILHLFHDGLQPMVLGLQVQNDNQHTTPSKMKNKDNTTLPRIPDADWLKSISRLLLTLSWPPLSFPYHQRMTHNFLAQYFNIPPVNLKLRGSNLCLARLLTRHAPLLQRLLLQPTTTISATLGNNPKVDHLFIHLTNKIICNIWIQVQVPSLNGKKRAHILLSYPKRVVALPRHHPKKLVMAVFSITLQTIHQGQPTKLGLKINPLIPFPQRLIKKDIYESLNFELLTQQTKPG
ncbi:uncharacterized protein G2W53_026785 [Senna tora]|uniref:Uncharacterized protein n=1 Tax=Senna tora TaxID=362788 RepID=A0A834WFE4_9FABA|nr:uncharacterized protein G2W53_026785 [Senna tora]